MIERVSPTAAAIASSIENIQASPPANPVVIGDEHSAHRAACAVATHFYLPTHKNEEYGCRNLEDFPRNSINYGSAPLNRHAYTNADEEAEAADRLAAFPLSEHPSVLFGEKYEEARITVVMTQYKRNTTELQLKSIFEQTVFSRIDKIVIMQNDDFVDLSFLTEIDFSTFIIDPKADLKKCAKVPNEIQSCVQIINSGNRNLKYHGRFAVALLFDTEFTAVFDDDTIPQPMWLEVATAMSRNMNAIVGPVGVIIDRDKQSYFNPPIDFALEVQ
jgi:hypothetical protein